MSAQNVVSLLKFSFLAVFPAVKWQGEETSAKLLTLSKLRDGWRFGEGLAISPTALDHAHKLNDMALRSGNLKTDAFPGRKGDVTLAIYKGDFDYAFKVQADGLILVDSESQEMDETGPLPLAEALDLVKSLGFPRWNLSSYFTLPSLIPLSNASEARPSRTQVAAAVYPSSSEPVLWQRPVAYAIMPVDSIAA